MGEESIVEQVLIKGAEMVEAGVLKLFKEKTQEAYKQKKEQLKEWGLAELKNAEDYIESEHGRHEIELMLGDNLTKRPKVKPVRGRPVSGGKRPGLPVNANPDPMLGSLKHWKKKKKVGSFPASKTILLDDLKDDKEMEDDGIFNGWMTRVKGSFVKMPKYRRGRYGRKKRRRSRRSVTRRGVKNMIANYVPDRRITYADYNNGFCYGGFGERGFKVIPFLYGGAFNSNITNFPGDLKGFGGYLETSTIFNWTSGKPFSIKNYHAEFMFHNPMTDIVIVTVWRIKQKKEDESIATNLTGAEITPPWKRFDRPFSTTVTWPTGGFVDPQAQNGPLKRWYELALKINNGIDLTTFSQAFADYPTQYKEWNDDYKIKGKTKFVLQPGQTKKLNIRFGNCTIEPKNLTITSPAYDSDTHAVYYQDITQFIMIQTEGVPTHQNDGEGDSATRQLINRSPTALEWTSIRRCSLGVKPTQMSSLHLQNTFDTSTVTAARSIITQVDAEVKTV